ncbi:hypothetical protein OY671_007661, partial [Metschnikowia pulcherrima]
MDAIYTPPELAQFSAGATSSASPASIADFAAGDGALLRAAAERWPDARLFGSDIDEAAVLSVGASIARCDAKVHDLLADGNDSALGNQTFNLILLNPPFSCRGNTRFQAAVAGKIYSASKASAFVARALKYLSVNGELIAILPASVLVSERDAELIAAIRAWGSVEQIGDVRKNAFRSHSVTVTVLRISRSSRKHKSAGEKPSLVSLRPYAVEMSRGSLSVHDYVETKTGPRFIHTTDMREGRLAPTKRKASATRRRVHGPAVLISRVGRPSKDKVVRSPSCEAVSSDCVVALRTVPAGHEQASAAAIVENWEIFKAAYGGSCAPYTTLKRLAETLLRLGIASSIMADDLASKKVPASHI